MKRLTTLLLAAFALLSAGKAAAQSTDIEKIELMDRLCLHLEKHEIIPDVHPDIVMRLYSYSGKEYLTVDITDHPEGELHFFAANGGSYTDQYLTMNSGAFCVSDRGFDSENRYIYNTLTVYPPEEGKIWGLAVLGTVIEEKPYTREYGICVNRSDIEKIKSILEKSVQYSVLRRTHQ